MKKCPYCAEEIQNEAIICRFCGKRVKGIWFRRIVIVIVIVALVAFIFNNKAQIQKIIDKLELFFKGLGEIWEILKDMPRLLRDGLAALRESNQGIDHYKKLYQAK